MNANDQTNDIDVNTMYQAVRSKYIGIYPTPILKIAFDLGIKVNRSNIDGDDILGFIEKDNHGKFIIHVNKKNNESEETFTIAHEIGHFVLHQDVFNDDHNLIVDYKKTMNNQKNRDNYSEIEQNRERAADEFAVKLLLPDSNVFDKGICLS